jgi:molybdopterin converting factor small subunit
LQLFRGRFGAGELSLFSHDESPDAWHLDLSLDDTKAVDLGASRRETEATTRYNVVIVRFYGRLADAIGSEVELAGAGGRSVGEVRKRLAESHVGAAAAIERSRALIADSFVSDEHRVGECDSLEFLPPVSGG